MQHATCYLISFPPHSRALTTTTMTTVAEKTDSATYNKGVSSDASDPDAESVSGPPQQATLKRQLKNRHIAMIRCVALQPPPLSRILTFVKYWWCHRYRSFRWNSERFGKWRSTWSLARLHRYGYHCILCYDYVGRNGLPHVLLVNYVP